jgi:hypothetical protein
LCAKFAKFSTSQNWKKNPHLIKIPQMLVQMKTTSFQCPIHKSKDLKIENPFHISGYISTWASLTIITSFSKNKFKKNYKPLPHGPIEQ